MTSRTSGGLQKKSWSITDEQAGIVEDLAQRFGVSESQVVRDALAAGLPKYEAAMEAMSRRIGKVAS